MDHRQRNNFFNVSPVLNHGLPELGEHSLVGTTLEHLFLVLEEVILKATNIQVEDEMGDVTFGELLKFLVSGSSPPPLQDLPVEIFSPPTQLMSRPVLLIESTCTCPARDST